MTEIITEYDIEEVLNNPDEYVDCGKDLVLLSIGPYMHKTFIMVGKDETTDEFYITVEDDETSQDIYLDENQTLEDVFNKAIEENREW